MGYILKPAPLRTSITTVLTSTNNFIVAPAGKYIVGLALTPTIDEQVDVSDTISGGIDIEENFPIYEGVSSTIAINKKYDVATNIYIDNYAENITATLHFI